MNYSHMMFALYAIGMAAVVLFLSHYGFGWAAALLLALPLLAQWWRASRGQEAALTAVPTLAIGWSVVGFISLTNEPSGQLVFPPVSQLVLTIMLAAWIGWWRFFIRGPRSVTIAAALSQFSVTSIIFLAAAFWHWPAVVVLMTMWASSYTIAFWYLRSRRESAAAVLAATWALIAAEAAWVFNTWLVNYVLGGGYVIIPQAAVVVLGLGYCFLNIYTAHIDKSLSRRRLIEYLIIVTVLLAIVVAGTHWSGAV